MLLNDVKLRLMRADASVSTANEKLLCDDGRRGTDTLYMSTQTLKTHASPRILSDLNSHPTSLCKVFNLLSLRMVVYQISPTRPQTHSNKHTHQGC